SNLSPEAIDDDVTAPKDLPAIIDVLANDADYDGTLDFTSIALVSVPAYGTATIEQTSDGPVVLYSPDPGFEGDDLFPYAVRDDEGALSNIATASLSVRDPITFDRPPKAINDAVITKKDVPIAVPVLENDFDRDGALDPTSLVLSTGPAH